MTLATGFHTIYQHIPAMPGIKKKEIIKKKKVFFMLLSEAESICKDDEQGIYLSQQINQKWICLPLINLSENFKEQVMFHRIPWTSI